MEYITSRSELPKTHAGAVPPPTKSATEVKVRDVAKTRTRRASVDFAAKVRDLTDHADAHHARYYESKTFGGPSLYFHLQALRAEGGDFHHRLEYIYAVLASWGMHRMAKGKGAKMRSFEEFEASVSPLQQKIGEGRKLNHTEMTEEGWSLLEEIFKSIKVMASGTSLVGNSKVMAHLMPNIVPPIDREYTLKFLKGNGDIRNDPDDEWSQMRSIIERLFIPVASVETFKQRASTWMADKEKFPWDTSIFKIIDNLIIGARQ
jgi:hypothetical protein